MPKKIDPAVRERALRMFAEHRQDYASDTALAESVATKLGIGRETARRWLCRPTSTPAPDPVQLARTRPRSSGSRPR